MPADVPAEDRIDTLLAERAAIALRPEAAKRQAQIDDQLKALGYQGDLGDAGPVETADEAPKRRGRPPAVAE